jgi:hypothetical protein
MNAWSVEVCIDGGAITAFGRHSASEQPVAIRQSAVRGC